MQLEKDIKFDGSKEELVEVFDLYKLSVLDVQCFKGGIINTSFCLKIEDGSKLVLRVYQNGDKSNDAIENELNFMEEMRISGVPVPLVIANIFDKKLTVFKDSAGMEWRAIIMTFAEGRHLESNDFEIIPEFATYQAKMHLVSSGLNKNLERSNFKTMVDWMDKEFNEIKAKELTKEIFGKVEEIHSDLKRNIELNFDGILALPCGDVHLDYDSDNIIVDNGKIKAILDFDDISNQPFVLDTANSIWWWLFKNKKEDYEKILSNYFESYQKIRNIIEEEYKFLNLFLRMRNLTLICLLYVNISEEINYAEVEKGLILDLFLSALCLRR
ncbi:MAG: phosphotransferase [bacterium]|nr:phosphotransferase [bacterium]